MKTREIMVTIPCATLLGLIGGAVAGTLTVGVGALKNTISMSDNLVKMPAATSQRISEKAVKAAFIAD